MPGVQPRFIAFEPEVQRRQASSPESELLFVDCHQPDGRTPEHRKVPIRRHVMRTHVRLHRDKAQLKADSKHHTISHLSAEGTTDIYLGDPRLILGNAIGPLLPSFETDHDFKDIVAWMMAGHSATQAKKFQAARCFYIRNMLELAFRQKLSVWHTHCRTSHLSNAETRVLDGLAVIAYRKKMLLMEHSVANQRQYSLVKGNLINSVRQHIAQSETFGSSIRFAIVILASCSAIDGDLRDSAVHLAGLRSMPTLAEPEPSIFWAYRRLLDVRVALFTGNCPVLGLGRARDIQKTFLTTSGRPDAMRLALLSPQVESTFALPRTAELYSKLLQLCRISEQEPETITLPVFELYEIEYELRNVHAQVLDTRSSPVQTCVELTILAMQLSIWIATRFFSPLTARGKSVVLHRAVNLLVSLSPAELLDAWTRDARADASSLLWVVALFSACLETELVESIALPLLMVVTDHLAVETEGNFLDMLQPWPPQNAWDRSRFSKVWAELVKFKRELSEGKRVQGDRQHGSPVFLKHGDSREEMPFFGHLEFWDV